MTYVRFRASSPYQTVPMRSHYEIWYHVVVPRPRCTVSMLHPGCTIDIESTSNAFSLGFHVTASPRRGTKQTIIVGTQPYYAEGYATTYKLVVLPELPEVSSNHSHCTCLHNGLRLLGQLQSRLLKVGIILI